MKLLKWCLLSLLFLPLVAVANPIAEKTAYLSLHVSGQAIKVVNVRIKSLKFYEMAKDESDFRYEILGKGGEVLYSSTFSDPLITFEDDFSDRKNPRGGQRHLDENTSHLKVPYLKKGQRIRFFRKQPDSDQEMTMGTAVIDPK